MHFFSLQTMRTESIYLTSSLFKTRFKVANFKYRYLFSETGRWPITCAFDPWCVVNFLKEIEHRWKPILCKEWKEKLANPDPSRTDHRYILSMFPYPSGSLHLGMCDPSNSLTLPGLFNCRSCSSIHELRHNCPLFINEGPFCD